MNNIMQFKNEYVPALKKRVNRNNRFEVINIEQKWWAKSKPRVKVQLKNNNSRNGYSKTQLKIKNTEANHTIYKKTNGTYHVKFASNRAPPMAPIPLNTMLIKPNGRGISVRSLLNNSNNQTSISIEPLTSNAVYLEFGRTAANKRGHKFGYNLRKFATNAANNSGMKLYQLSVNVNKLINKNNQNTTPYSGRIMKKLGAKRVSSRNVPGNITKYLPNDSMWFLYSPKKNV
jgi:hypothetical protein